MCQRVPVRTGPLGGQIPKTVRTPVRARAEFDIVPQSGNRGAPGLVEGQKGEASMQRVAACLLPMLALSPAHAATLEGDWETVISSPRRPWIFETHFERKVDAWKGVMSVRGYGELPLTGVEAGGDHVHFAFPPELDSLVFEGTMGD